MDTSYNFQQVAWHVHKIGGSILGTSENYSKVLQVIDHSKYDHLEFNKSGLDPKTTACVQGVVVSAMEGVTNTLLRMTQLAKSMDNNYETVCDQLLAKLIGCAEGLIQDASSQEGLKLFESDLRKDILKIKDILRAIAITKSMSEEMEDLIVGHGEVWSARLLTLFLQSRGVNANWLDTRQTLFVSKGECGPVVDWERSEAELANWMSKNYTPELSILIITGFVASSATGMPTTLGRNGSDYSASIFGAMLKSSLITIWKDVDGLFSADPKIVPKASILKEISYNEVSELSHYGANILHPHTMPPAIKNNIPIKIRNFFNLSKCGTLIHARSNIGPEEDTNPYNHNVKGFSAIRRVSLINVEGAGLGVSNLAQRVFVSLRDVHVTVLLISQGSSQSSICVAIAEKDGDISLNAIRKEFHNELKYTGHVQTIELVKDCSIIAAVGDQMVSSVGVASKLFNALSRRGINIKAIAQGSSERNISAVLMDKDTSMALRAVHSTFYRPFDPDSISIGIIGAGLIGSELLEQLKKQPVVNVRRPKHNFIVRAIANSKKMVVDGEGVSLDKWKSLLGGDTAQDFDVDVIAESILVGHPKHSVIIDCTASKELPKSYPKWLAQGIHVITPNKVGFSSQLALYKDIQSTAHSHFTHCLYETTVGGGLPILHMVQQMVATGDRITRIEGIFSGTLSYIFNQYGRDSNIKFSDIVLAAKSKGFTEPDPRDDLNGMDFARKIIILAREIVDSFEANQVDVVSLIPADDKEAATAPVDQFLSNHLLKLDAVYDAMRVKAASNNQVLRYSGVIEVDHSQATPTAKASVSLRDYPQSHPFANLTECDNVIAIYSERYSKTPLVIQGPGAGATVTAAGIYGDLYRLSSFLQHV
ncbi:hypothetical protein SAMD00019534_056940 [Acytostelium subglobosum LB1]|uniref:hypothetical protein n=1 Tax=Acytostelium subglobosum LB1 TaxID=1410327 RepID=UPI000644D307|nr:hypothetical protein SAMD00019534_056940 [Acytostelium subglobosum LB1]GAM22519.1 hypothetical protein SAMD00019534_056940 [Acytostelium subglobosum LB1]|eukprot:XP_012754639.1 hypothetical protein SAMD00019534_056940 [Acytostelium subglobosum LB1]